MMTEVNNNPFQSDMDDKPKKRPTKGRVFQCTGFPGCNMSFTRSEHLARHKRKHTGERPFTCPYCSKKFSRLDNLRQHKQTVHAYETFMTKDNISPTQAIPSSNPSTPSDGIFPINDTTSTDSNNNNNNISNHGVPPQNYLPNSLISPPSSRSPHFNHNSNHILYQAPPQPGFYALPQSAMTIKGHSTLSHPHGDYIQHHDAYGQHHPLLLSQEINRPHMTTNSRSYSNSNSDSSLSSTDPVQQSDKNPPEIPPAVLIEKPLNNEYKPKRRPRPLALLDSFAKNSYQIPHMNDSSTSPTNSNFPSAFNGANSPYGNYPTLTPNIASPLSPLFHQSFNQTVNKYTNSRISNLNNSLRIPPIINSTANSKWLKDVLNNDKNSKITPHNIEVKPESNEGTISNPEEKDTPTEVLIESAEISTDTAVTTSASLTEGKSSTANKVNHTSKKPTINSLLSPNQTETFPEKISSRSSNYPALPSVQE